MNSKRGSDRQASDDGGVDLGPGASVVVSSGGGDRFHRPDGVGFVTACKTRFEHPIRQVTVAGARRDGFDPCEKPGCFGRVD